MYIAPLRQIAACTIQTSGELTLSAPTQLPLRAAHVFQHPTYPTRPIGRLGVGNAAVVLDERRAIAVTGERFNDQRGVRDAALWLSHDVLLDVGVCG